MGRTTGLTIDLRASLRRIKPERWRTQLARRPAAELIAAADLSPGRYAVLLDTNVYIRIAADSLPLEAGRLVADGLIFHSSACLSELSTGVANADPTLRGWRSLRDFYADVFRRVPEERLLTPDPSVWVEAALIAGTLARTQNYQPHQRKECLNDALIFLSAAKVGVPVLTSDRDDFDLIQQLAPHGRFIHF